MAVSVQRIARSLWPIVSRAGTAGSLLSLPRVLSRSAGDAPYQAEPPPVPGWPCYFPSEKIKQVGISLLVLNRIPGQGVLNAIWEYVPVRVKLLCLTIDGRLTLSMVRLVSLVTRGRSREHLGPCLVVERSMMKSSTFTPMTFIASPVQVIPGRWSLLMQYKMPWRSPWRKTQLHVSIKEFYYVMSRNMVDLQLNCTYDYDIWASSLYNITSYYRSRAKNGDQATVEL